MTYKGLITITTIVLLTFFSAACSRSGKQLPWEQMTVSISCSEKGPMISFALDELKSAFSDIGYSVSFAGFRKADVILLPSSASSLMKRMKSSLSDYSFILKPEGFSLQRDKKDRIWVAGGDIAGLMYGILELAEQIRIHGPEGIKDTDQNPYMEMRGIKFNIPLDVRTPSYSDMSDAGQINIPEVWNFDFWKETIDNLAKYRFNLISLWNLHPFPSMVKVPEYPDIALNDVKRSLAIFPEYFDTRATGYDAEEITANTETILTLTIEEKTDFWKRVMQYASERNIKFFIMTWNIYTYGIDGKYGIDDDINNETTKDYYRKSVREMILTYPLLAGIGVTTGENMGEGGGGFEIKEDWIYDTYAQGVLDALQKEPERKIFFIHRQHEAGTKYIIQKFEPLAENKAIEFIYSFKYAQAHVYSSLKQSYHKNFVNEIAGKKTMWTLRNDDNYYFRWGAPDFVRKFIKNIPYDISKGFYFGSDNYIWGTDFLSRDGHTPPRTELARQWYQWMLWGRLGYDPDISDSTFIKIIADRLDITDASSLFTAWQNASMVYPVTTGFHWGDLDFRWYIEGCKSRPEPAQTSSGFHDVNRFITLRPHPESGYRSIPDYVGYVTDHAIRAGDTLLNPPEVAQILHNHADKALSLIGSIDTNGKKELSETINDIKSMAYLGKYYANKIDGAASLALFRLTKNRSDKDNAVKQLTDALEYWKLYTESAMKQYKNPLWTNRVGKVDWVKLTDEAAKDIDIAKHAR
jgi:hypothetical protein